jgi:uncharacterized damage-inducible protein DinB
MQPDQAAFAAEMAVGGIEFEHPVTKKVLASMPEDKREYAPSPISLNALDLAWHIVSSEIWFLEGVAAQRFEMTEMKRPVDSIAEVVAWYEKAYPDALAKVRALSGEQLATVVEFFGMKFPAVVYLTFSTNHTIHHRGQYSTYLRCAGAKVPSIYGGSYDEPFQQDAATTA